VVMIRGFVRYFDPFHKSGGEIIRLTPYPDMLLSRQSASDRLADDPF
jgi:hypothetical protein